MGCLLKQGGGLYPRLRIGAVLLTAGQARRMGGLPKPLIRLQGVPLVRRLLVALSGAGVDEVVVVTGHARTAIEQQVRSFPVTLIHNAEHANGQSGSVRRGLEALNGPFDAVFVVPADLPLLAADDLTELISAFKKRPEGHVVVPMVGAQRGNPILLDAEALAEILASGKNLACRHFIDNNSEYVYVHETANTRFVTDLDTPDDVKALADKTSWQFELPDAVPNPSGVETDEASAPGMHRPDLVL